MGALIHTPPVRRESRIPLSLATARLLMAAAFLLAGAGCGGLRLPFKPQARQGDWQTFGRGSDRNAIAPATLSPPLTIAWTAGISAGAGRGSPVVADSFAFVGTLRGELYAFRTRDGYQLGRVSLGAAIDGSPAIVAGSVIAATAYSSHSLVRFDLLDGTLMWEAPCGDLEATPLVVGDRVYVGNTSGVLTCVNLRSGMVLWHFAIPDNERVKGIRSAAAAFDTLVIFGADDGIVYALGAASGTLAWEYRAGAVVLAPPVVSDSAVVICTLGGTVSALSGRTGRAIWSRSVFGGVAGPAVVAGERVVVTTLRGTIEALDRATGSPLWKGSPGTPMNSGGVVTGEFFFAGTLTKELLAVRMTDGEIVWKLQLDGRVKSGPAVAGGKLFIATDAQTLVALETPRRLP
jgi:eukaryotic-like serine/threonine-protein kinase